MNTREFSCTDCDEQELSELIGRFVRTFRRLPTHDDLMSLRRAQSGLRLRLPAQGRRSGGPARRSPPGP